jgi:hypothetical protein
LNIHLFKNFVGDLSSIAVRCVTKSDFAPNQATVALRVYNHNTNSWETKDTNSAAGSDEVFTLSAFIGDLTNYKNASKVMSWRIDQSASD